MENVCVCARIHADSCARMRVRDTTFSLCSMSAVPSCFFFIFSDTDIRIYACFPELCLPDPTSFLCCMAAYNASKCVS